MGLPRGPGRPGRPFKKQTGSTVSVPIVSPQPGVYSSPGRRFIRGPGKPGQSFKATARDARYVPLPGVPSASAYWGPMYPNIVHSFWDGMYPEAALVAFEVVPPIPPEGVATFAMLIEAGLTVTYAWQTDIFKSFSGKERRASVLDAPRQTYNATAVLIDDAVLTTRTELASSASTGSVFMLALPYEGVTISETSSGNIIPVASTAALASW